MTHNEAIRPSVVRVSSYVAVHTALYSSTPFVEFAARRLRRRRSRRAVCITLTHRSAYNAYFTQHSKL